MFKNFIITILCAALALVWLRDDRVEDIDSDNEISKDIDDVTIEYKCSELDNYATVPPEVVEECIYRMEENNKQKVDKKPLV